ncbi:HAD family hydrolase [Gilvimarinus sp. SDUM040013]|uniref:HAD family hydrolase n=1 Tax=Gilvimarinus gilvus TaxID=3058038 RepID=A0ABU4RUU5_9GAMM|nr:HAD family hydrolase [Gilvimarinus sp. SDUM040013]MDO3388473.1 HAD family hydrolase [Gilvimarinus sp. SDUM040013]MDX6848655.1 HAD family hydrolase [Gilvimarinus sp. SDUM040013]
MRLCFVLLISLFTSSLVIADPLPSWVDAKSKQSIIEFVETVTDSSGDKFVPVADRIAVFDNDGTLWSEQPVYFQIFYALDRIQRLAKEDPSILTSDALKAANKGDIKAVAAGGMSALTEVINLSHANISVTDFQADVKQWLKTARHPGTGLAYNHMVYQPMLELLSYLRDNDFKTYIVTGGGIHFVRAFAESTYGIPPEQVVGSQLNLAYETSGSSSRMVKKPDIAFVDDGPGKPVAIDIHIGRKPIFAGGNSDGDFQMLEWTSSNKLPNLAMIVHHTDAKREFSYDKKSHIGKLEKGMDQAADRGWLLVDMKNEWKSIYPE